MRNSTELRQVLSRKIDALSEMSDGELAIFLQLTERAYVHALIEQQLRQADSGVSRMTRPLRGL